MQTDPSTTGLFSPFLLIQLGDVIPAWHRYPDLRPLAHLGNVENWAIPLDVVQEGDNIIVKASVPGVNPEDIDVSIENDVLTIKGQTKEEREHQEGNYLMRERRSGSFYRALRLPDTLDSDQAQPHYEHGVLSITFPRMESKKARRLQISGA